MKQKLCQIFQIHGALFGKFLGSNGETLVKLGKKLIFQSSMYELFFEIIKSFDLIASRHDTHGEFIKETTNPIKCFDRKTSLFNN